MEIQNSQFTQIPEIFDIEKSTVITPKKTPTPAEVQDWLVSYLANLLEIDLDEVDVTVSFDRYGLDSATAIGMTGNLEEWLGYELDPTLIYDYPTIKALAENLAEEDNAKT
jgi:acyl carrier protein